MQIIFFGKSLVFSITNMFIWFLKKVILQIILLVLKNFANSIFKVIQQYFKMSSKTYIVAGIGILTRQSLGEFLFLLFFFLSSSFRVLPISPFNSLLP